jgi:F0F1-type ATP synthase membrane subunit b/b'
MISEAWGVPLGNEKCIIERGTALNILDDIKNSLPLELAEAKRLVSAKEEFIGNAKREAESIRKLAEERARHMVEEQEIIREAKYQSARILTEAEQSARQTLEEKERRSA